MTTFALLHGGMHWGPCWELVRLHLEADGHTVVAPDLPIDDDESGAMSWAETATAAIDSSIGADDPDVLPFSAHVAKVGTEADFGWDAVRISRNTLRHSHQGDAR